MKRLMKLSRIIVFITLNWTNFLWIGIAIHGPTVFRKMSVEGGKGEVKEFSKSF